MGSEMCIRDSAKPGRARGGRAGRVRAKKPGFCEKPGFWAGCRGCLLYTSDAADERSSVDLGGRRIIKKKNRCEHS